MVTVTHDCRSDAEIAVLQTVDTTDCMAHCSADQSADVVTAQVTVSQSVPLPSNRQHPSYGDCLEGKRGDYLTSSVLLCIIIVHIICTPI